MCSNICSLLWLSSLRVSKYCRAVKNKKNCLIIWIQYSVNITSEWNYICTLFIYALNCFCNLKQKKVPILTITFFFYRQSGIRYGKISTINAKIIQTFTEFWIWILFPLLFRWLLPCQYPHIFWETARFWLLSWWELVCHDINDIFIHFTVTKL